jgi:hypothetical protein
MIAAVRMTLAAVALFLDVVHIAVGRELPVTANDAAAGERGEPEEPNKTTHDDPLLQRRLSNSCAGTFVLNRVTMSTSNPNKSQVFLGFS